MTMICRGGLGLPEQNDEHCPCCSGHAQMSEGWKACWARRAPLAVHIWRLFGKSHQAPLRRQIGLHGDLLAARAFWPPPSKDTSAGSACRLRWPLGSRHPVTASCTSRHTSMFPRLGLCTLALLLHAWGVHSRAQLQSVQSAQAQDCISSTSVPIADLNVTLCESPDRRRRRQRYSADVALEFKCSSAQGHDQLSFVAAVLTRLTHSHNPAVHMGLT